MFLQDEEIRKETAKAMAVARQEELRLQPILKGGSDRRFLRAEWGKGSCIVMEYGLDREENAFFTGIGRFLEKMDIDVPRILKDDPEKRLVWTEDLGVRDLWSFREKSWAERAPLYRSALEQINLLHNEGLNRAKGGYLQFMPGFDLPMYAWERNYFYEKFAGVACSLRLTDEQKAALEKTLVPAAEALVKEKPSLVHRDFQSQNIMVRSGWTYLIDFQGMRQGTGYYDLASLLYDPYVKFAPQERQELVDFYYSLPGFRPNRDIYNTLFRYAALQRLMQALGAYGFLGIEKGKESFLQHVEPALNNLELVVSELQHLEMLKDLIGECRRAFANRD